MTSTRRTGFSAREVAVTGLFAAMLSASAWISIPLPMVPVTLQVFIVLLAGLLLRPLAAGLSVGVYLALGAVGVPVFAGPAGGLGILAGPTGGYLLGFAVAAVTVSVLSSQLGRTLSQVVADSIAVLVGVAVIYLFGWLQLMFVTGLGPLDALIAGVLPFVPLDIAKAVVAVGVAGVVRRTGVLERT